MRRIGAVLSGAVLVFLLSFTSFASFAAASDAAPAESGVATYLCDRHGLDLGPSPCIPENIKRNYDLKGCYKNDPQYDKGICGWKWASALANEAQKMRKELKDVTSVAVAQKESHKKVVAAIMEDYDKATGLVRKAAEQNVMTLQGQIDMLGVLLVIALAIVILAVIYALVKRHQINLAKKRLEAELQGQVDQFARMRARIAELEARVRETEIQGFQLVVSRSGISLRDVEDQDPTKRVIMFDYPVCPGGLYHPKHTGSIPVSPANFHDHFRT